MAHLDLFTDTFPAHTLDRQAALAAYQDIEQAGWLDEQVEAPPVVTFEELLDAVGGVTESVEEVVVIVSHMIETKQVVLLDRLGLA